MQCCSYFTGEGWSVLWAHWARTYEKPLIQRNYSGPNKHSHKMVFLFSLFFKILHSFWQVNLFGYDNCRQHCLISSLITEIQRSGHCRRQTYDWPKELVVWGLASRRGVCVCYGCLDEWMSAFLLRAQASMLSKDSLNTDAKKWQWLDVKQLLPLNSWMHAKVRSVSSLRQMTETGLTAPHFFF